MLSKYSLHKDKISFSAIVLGLEINGLGIVRSLSKQKIKVLGIYTNNTEIGRFSKYCTAIKLSADNENFSDNLFNLLVSISSYLKEKAVIFPTSDFYVKFLNSRRKTLKDSYHFPIPEESLINEIISKKSQYILAAQQKMSLPKTYIFNSFDDFLGNKDIIQYPCILKPLDSFSGQLPDNAKNLIFNSYNSLELFYNKYPGTINQSIVQEIIPGGDQHVYYCTMYFNKLSKLIAAFSARKIRQSPPDFGITCFAESIKSPKVIKLAEYFLKKIGFSGLIDIEFMWDERDQCFKFIEMNPRTHWANYHSTDCGVNLPLIAYQDLKGKSMDHHFKIKEQKNGIRWIYLKADLIAFLKNRKKRNLSFIDWLISVCQSRSFGCFFLEDPLPFFFDLYYLFLTHVKKIRTFGLW